MVVLVCGSREWTDRATIRAWLDKLPAGTVIVHGAARGADAIAGEEAKARGLAVRAFPADWRLHGKAAGPIRNQQMLDEGRPGVALAFTDALTREGGRLTGTGDMVTRAVAAGVRVTIVPPAKLGPCGP